MSWTTPRTWSVGEVLTAALLNTHLRDQFNFIRGYRKTTTKSVVSTVAATDLLNGEITIPAGMLGSDGVLRLRAAGDWVNNAGAQVTPRFQLVLGGTTLIDTSVPANGINGSASGVGWALEATIANRGATNVQDVTLRGYVIEATSRAAGAGYAYFSVGSGVYTQDDVGPLSRFDGVAAAAVDTTAACALVLNVINGSNSASYQVNLLSALVELL